MSLSTIPGDRRPHLLRIRIVQSCRKSADPDSRRVGIATKAASLCPPAVSISSISRRIRSSSAGTRQPGMASESQGFLQRGPSMQRLGPLRASRRRRR